MRRLANFESGVSGYVKAIATVSVYFPVDHRGEAEICCDQCKYFRRSTKSCGLAIGEICEYPMRHVGSRCPLKLEENDETV